MVKSVSKKYKVSRCVKAALLLLMVFVFSEGWGQATLPLSRTAWATEPTGWTNSGCTQRTTSSACSGNDATIFDTNGDFRTVFFNAAPNQLIFTLKNQSMSGASSLLVQESPDGSTWSNIGNYGTAGGATAITNGVCTTFTLTLSCASRYVKWTYTKASGNCDMDDVSISAGSCATTHTVTFNANTGTGSMAAQTASTTTNLTANAFTKAGCTFTGWNTAANGSGTSYSDGQAYSFAADLTLYAQWSCAATSHTVTFNANTGTGSMAAQTASTTTNLTSNTFTKAGCSFTGWNTAANGSGTAYSDGQAYSFAADLTLYAQWNCGSTCPYFVAAVVNACAGSCSGEGNNEFIVMNSGSYSIPVNGTDLNIVYNNGTDNYFTQSYAAQPGAISNLNSLAGCGTLFVDVSTSTIPANSTFFIMNQGSCFNNGSFSAYCGVGTIYVAFSSDPTWSSGGFFGNNNSPRYFRTDFSSINGACGVTTYSYNQSNEFNFGSDGASVVFNGTSPSYINGNGDCVPPVAILPITLIDFFATANGDKNDIVWKVESEEGIRNYVVEKSEDGVNFTELSRLKPGASAAKYITYTTEDLFPAKGITYYRLSTIESDYSYKRYKIIDVDRNSKDWNVLLYQYEQDVVLEFKNTVPKNSSVDMFDLSGKLLISKTIDQSHVTLNTNELSTGIYFVRITTAYKTENFKIVIQK